MHCCGSSLASTRLPGALRAHSRAGNMLDSLIFPSADKPWAGGNAVLGFASVTAGTLCSAGLVARSRVFPRTPRWVCFFS